MQRSAPQDVDGFESAQIDPGNQYKPTAKRRLACVECQRRKVKCDRNVPCLACRGSGKQCVPVANQRLPRGTAGGRKTSSDLISRIRKLEGLVKDLQSLGQPTGPGQSSSRSSPEGGDAAAHLRGQYQYLGSAFWTSLQDELRKLEGELGNDGNHQIDSADDLTEDVHTPTDSNSSDPSPPLDPVFGMIASPILLQHPLPMLKKQLCISYFNKVDAVFKVLHKPSVCAYIELGASYLNYRDGHSAVTALEFVIYYAAIATMSEDDCTNILWQPKQQVLRQFRTMAEAALVQADYVTTTDLTTLQALVIYLALLRYTDRSRRTWTMAALAVRIALAIGLQNERPGCNVFDTEQRRRLWHGLCVLDLQLAVDLASDRLIMSTRSDTHLPLNINDMDISYGSNDPVDTRVGWTDMSFSLISQEIAIEADRSHSTESLEHRQDIIHTLETTLHARYLVHCNPEIPLQAFAMAFTRGTVAACRLHSIRGTSKASPNLVSPPIYSEDVLSQAVEALTYSGACQTNPTICGWRWVLWAQWHAIAVAFAALSFGVKGPVVEKAWVVVEPAFQHFTSTVAAGQQTQMCRPLEKLAQKARMMTVTSTTSDHATARPVEQPNNPVQADADRTASADVDQYFSDLPNIGEDWGFLDDFFVQYPDEME